MHTYLYKLPKIKTTIIRCYKSSGASGIWLLGPCIVSIAFHNYIISPISLHTGN